VQIGGLTYVKLRSSMVKARRENLPPVPHSISELADILDDPQYEFLVSSMDGNDLIYTGKFGQSDDGTLCIMFASMRHVKDVMSDATFCVPTVLDCRQVWNIVTLRRNHVCKGLALIYFTIIFYLGFMVLRLFGCLFM